MNFNSIYCMNKNKKIGVWCAWDDQDGDGLGRIRTSILIADWKTEENHGTNFDS